MDSQDERVQNPLVRKLFQFIHLSDKDVGVLDALCSREERFKGGINILLEGDAPASAFVVTRGMACRYRLLVDGGRQILTFLIPGDLFDLHAFLLSSIDHSIGTIGPTRLAAIDRDTVIDVVTHHPRIRAALWWSAMQEDAMLRERIVALGRRGARGRLAYFLCEIVWRQRAIGMSRDHAIRLPLTQTDLADALGPDRRARQPRPAEVQTGRADDAGAASAHSAQCREARGHFRCHAKLSPTWHYAI